MEMTYNSVSGAVEWENVGKEIQSKFFKYIDEFQLSNDETKVPLTFKEWIEEYAEENNLF